MNAQTIYRTIREARSALAINTGFDPFLSGGWGRCTKAKLADAGYVVDPRKWRRQQQQRQQREARVLCRECGQPAEREIFCAAHGIGNCRLCPTQHTGFCREHTKNSYQCDNGHRWTATESEDSANGHHCPKCGEYWV
jgi:hypothetical protein